MRWGCKDNEHRNEKSKKGDTDSHAVAFAIVEHELQCLISAKINNPDCICAYSVCMTRISVTVEEQRWAVNFLLFGFKTSNIYERVGKGAS